MASTQSLSNLLIIVGPNRIANQLPALHSTHLNVSALSPFVHSFSRVKCNALQQKQFSPRCWMRTRSFAMQVHNIFIREKGEHKNNFSRNWKLKLLMFDIAEVNGYIWMRRGNNFYTHMAFGCFDFGEGTFVFGVVLLRGWEDWTSTGTGNTRSSTFLIKNYTKKCVFEGEFVSCAVRMQSNEPFESLIYSFAGGVSDSKSEVNFIYVAH